MKKNIFPFAVVILASVCAAAAEFTDLKEFLSRLAQQPTVEAPRGASFGGAEVIMVKGAPVGPGPHCDLIEKPGDREAGVCTYHCDGPLGIITRPAEKISSGAGAPGRPDCYSSIVASRHPHFL